MLKIWAKIITGDKIKKDLIYRSDEKFAKNKLHSYLIEICHEMDVPTPVVLKSHIKNFDSFNITRFKASDFVESVDFDSLVLENASE